VVVLGGGSWDDSLWIKLFTIDVLITLFAISLKMIYICPIIIQNQHLNFKETNNNRHEED